MLHQVFVLYAFMIEHCFGRSRSHFDVGNRAILFIYSNYLKKDIHIQYSVLYWFWLPTVVSDPRNILDSNKNCGNGRKPGLENHNVPKQNQRLSNDPITPPKDKKSEQTKNQETLMKKNSSVVKPNRPFNPESGTGRPTKPTSVEQRVQNKTKFQPKPEKITTERRPQASQLDVSFCKCRFFLVCLLGDFNF